MKHKNPTRLSTRAWGSFDRIKQPIDSVQWVHRDRIIPNTYNPNAQAEPEHKLLIESIAQDGWTQAIVVRKQKDDTFRIVDGEHRYRASGHKRIMARDKGMLPVVILDVSDGRAVASTVRHNRARGTHSVQKTAEIIQQLSNEGWDNARIIRELGMSEDEINRLKVANDLPGVLAGRDKYMSPS